MIQNQIGLAPVAGLCGRMVLVLSFCLTCWSSTNAQLQPAREWFPSISSERWNEMANSRSIRKNAGTIMRLFSRMKTTPNSLWPEVTESADEIDLSQLARAPEGYVGMALRVTGTAKAVVSVKLEEDLRSSFDAEKFYVVECEVLNTNSGQTQTVYFVCNWVPQSWRTSNTISEPIASTGLFLTTLDEHPVLISKQFEWYPVSETMKGVSAGQIALASAGMNIALLDQLKPRTNSAFTTDEWPMLSSLMQSIQTMESDHYWERLRESSQSCWQQLSDPPPLDLLPILRRSSEHRGKLITLTGKVRRISKIKIESTTLIKQLKQDHYFHIDLYVPIKDVSLQINDQQGNQVGLGPTMGTTLLMLKLPEGMRVTEKVNEGRWQVTGFFIKNWQHKTVDSREVSRTLRRPNPIIFGISRTAQRVQISSQPNNSIAWIVGGFWVGLIGLSLLIVHFRMRLRRA